jgi:hypothetical protein
MQLPIVHCPYSDTNAEITRKHSRWGGIIILLLENASKLGLEVKWQKSIAFSLGEYCLL